jgi:hypothetical protein
MTKKKGAILAFCGAGLALIAIGIFVVMLVFGILAERVELWDGGAVYVTRGGTHHIYLEDNTPPSMNNRNFVFVSTATGARYYSMSPRMNMTYAVGSVVINNQVRSGTFGRRVATVTLPSGEYTIQTDQWNPAMGVFRLGSPLGNLARNIVGIILSSFAFLALVSTGAILISLHVGDKKRQEWAERNQAT